jgi:hypothetical protein
MTNDDLDRKMGGRAGEEHDLGGGQRTPGRNPNDQQTGQKGAGQNNPADEDDDLGTGGGASELGRTPQGGQNR